MNKLLFNQITIVGTGLLGGSLAKDCRKLGLAKRIVGVCRSPKTAQIAISENVVDKILPLLCAIEKADLVVMATPMQSMLPLLLEMRGKLPQNCLITDVGSVKGHLYEQIKQQCPDLLSRFVLAHPIAGGEDAGIAASKLGLFKNKHVIITPTAESERGNNIETIRNLWRQCGANVIEMPLQAHDAIFAKTSHLPHVIAFALVNYLNNLPNRDQLFDMAAAGFYDFTRIASSDAVMWRDICVTNKAQIVAALDGFQDQIATLKAHIEAADEDAILHHFQQAKSARDAELDDNSAG